MSTVVVGTDGSEPAHRAVKEAADLAKALHAQLDIVYVSVPILLPPITYTELIDELTRKERAYAERILAHAASVASQVGIGVRPSHLTGAPVDTLLAVADQDDVLALVVGSRGRGAVARVLLGSVADRLVQLSRKPVLVVR
jgi:nucleotide-binding universal stress UspA family protein